MSHDQSAVTSHGDGAHVARTLGRWDLVLLKIVAIVNINNVPAAAVYGWFSIVLWLLAFVAFFVPEAIAVLVLSRRYPGEGGIYLWIRRQFGDAHGFLAGWCYWTNNLFYIPVLLVYMAGILAFSGGEARAATLVTQKTFVAAVAFGWLAIITVANIRGLSVGKWIQNIGGMSGLLSVALVLAAAGAALAAGVDVQAPAITGVSWEMTTSFAVMCNALVGIELASTMGDEMRDPARDLGPAIAIAGAVSILSYVLVTAAVLLLVPGSDLGVIQGIMQAVSVGAGAAGAGWLVAPMAIFMGVSIGGAASAWFAGSSRIPFVAGLTSALPAALGRVHPRYQSPHVALLTAAVFCALFTTISFVGSSVAEAYQVLLKAAVVIQLIPFTYLFLALVKATDVPGWARAAGVVGLVTTALGLAAAFLPTAEVGSVWVFELKLLAGVIGPTGLGWFLFWRSSRPGVSA
ncbi:MAG TPA: APC family permease [Vicinamibacterales bacterium]|nr:APC family permease [Vicinamibacterales bacterium]